MINKKSKEIGSYFDINPLDLEIKIVDKKFEPFGNAAYLSTCRSAINLVLKKASFNNRIALLPGFTCHAVVEPFVKNGFRVVPYQVSSNLEIDIDEFKKTLKEQHPSVILFHDYFGFDSNEKIRHSGLIEQLINDGIVIINDQTQSMFSLYDPLPANYYLGSIRKWIGIPDGAYLKGLNVDKFKSDILLEEVKVRAMVYKHKYLFADIGTKAEVLSNYRKAEDVLDSREQGFAISETSKKLIGQCDIENLRKKRRENAQMLLDILTKCEEVYCPFESVRSNEVPFHLPILVKNSRKEFQTYLAMNNVFATVIWGCPNELKTQINTKTRSIYNEILCIPCDQRYSKEDMKYICNLIENYNWEN